jgi:hypothetical protein
MMAIHAAALRFGSSCVLLSGSSGTGKTTLALAGMHEGHGYLADDLVLLQRRAPRIVPVGNGLCLKESGLKLAARFSSPVTRLMRHRRPDGIWVRYMKPPHREDEGVWPLKAIFFSKQSANATTASRLKPEDALHELLTNCCSVPDHLDSDDIRNLLDLIGGCEAYKIDVSDPIKAVRLIAELCAQGQADRRHSSAVQPKEVYYGRASEVTA